VLELVIIILMINIPNIITTIDVTTQHIDPTTIQLTVPIPLRPLLLRLPECVGNMIMIIMTAVISVASKVLAMVVYV